MTTQREMSDDSWLTVPQLRRLCREEGHYATVDIIDRKLSMRPSARAAILARWKKEDEETKNKEK